LVKARPGAISSDMTTLAATTLSILMLAGMLLAGAGLYLILSRRERGKGALMLVAAAVMFGNVLVWSL
jgi:hypothetical protein